MVFRAAMALWRGPQSIFDKVNPEYQSLFGDRQLLGKSFGEAVPELDDLISAKIRRVFESGSRWWVGDFSAPTRVARVRLQRTAITTSLTCVSTLLMVRRGVSMITLSTSPIG